MSMTETRRFCVCNRDGIPFGEQEYMTLPEAVARYNREVKEAIELFDIDPKEAEKMFLIKDMETYTTVL